MVEQRKITVYTFDELTGEARERAAQWLREGATDHQWWEFVYDALRDDLASVGVELTDANFSGFWSQGDGASFTGRVVDVAKFVAAVAPDNHRYAWLASLLDDPAAEVRFTRSTSHYVHEHTVDTEVDCGHAWNNRRSTYADGSQFDAVLGELRADAEAWRLARSKQLYRDLESEYDAITSDECLADNAAANEYRFDRNGRPIGHLLDDESSDESSDD